MFTRYFPLLLAVFLRLSLYVIIFHICIEYVEVEFRPHYCKNMKCEKEKKWISINSSTSKRFCCFLPLDRARTYNELSSNRQMQKKSFCFYLADVYIIQDPWRSQMNGLLFYLIVKRITLWYFNTSFIGNGMNMIDLC